MVQCATNLTLRPIAEWCHLTNLTACSQSHWLSILKGKLLAVSFTSNFNRIPALVKYRTGVESILFRAPSTQQLWEKRYEYFAIFFYNTHAQTRGLPRDINSSTMPFSYILHVKK